MQGCASASCPASHAARQCVISSPRSTIYLVWHRIFLQGAHTTIAKLFLNYALQGDDQ